MVAKESDLYYDPTELIEAARTVWDAENGEGDRDEPSSSAPRSGIMQRTDSSASMGIPGHAMSMSPQQHRGSYPGQQQMYGNVLPPGMGQMPGTPVRAHLGYAATYGGVLPGNFYGETGTPTRMMPDAMRRVTRGMAEDYPGLYGN